jgi:hypothetical protein
MSRPRKEPLVIKTALPTVDTEIQRIHLIGDGIAFGRSAVYERHLENGASKEGKRVSIRFVHDPRFLLLEHGDEWTALVPMDKIGAIVLA